jgi:FemAB-related protein (PEP-CTERM system-associated)
LPFVEFRSRLFGRFGVSLPFVNQGGVVAEDEDVARALADRAIEVARSRGLAHLELRHEQRRFPDLADKQHKVSMRLPLPETADGLWNSLDRKARNQVRKSEKSGLAADTGGVELVGAFYRVFSENMRDLGTPVYPRAFFEAIMTRFPDRTRIHVVRLGDEVVASSLTIAWRNSVEVPWASSLRRHRDKSPNNLLSGRCAAGGYRPSARLRLQAVRRPTEGTYHQGAGVQPGPCTGVQLGSGAMPDQSPANWVQAAIAVWQRLPLWAPTRRAAALSNIR